MSPVGPGVYVSTLETPTSAGISQTTGTLFAVGSASYGPEVPQLVKSLNEAIFYYGPRSEAESTQLIDGLTAFFTLGGQRAYVQRSLGAGIEFAKLELEAGATPKTLNVKARFKGTYANSIKIRVTENAGKTESALEILNSESELLESSGMFAKASEIFEWGKTHEAYVKVEEGSGYAAGKGSILKVLAATKLAGGVNPTVTEAEVKKAIEQFSRELGPGQLGVFDSTNGVKEAVHTAMAEHCVLTMKNLRVALCDLKEAAKKETTVATLISEKGSPAAALAQNMIFYSSACTCQGVTIGTTRTIPASAIVAGLCAQVAAKLNDAVNPSGPEFPLSPFVQGFTNTFTQSQSEELSAKGINSFKEVNGVPCSYGFVSAVSKEKNLIFWQASCSRERMAVVAHIEAVGAKYLFKLITPAKIAKFKADCQAVCKREIEQEALLAALVNTGEPVNTAATQAAGELNVEVLVQIPPFANVVSMVVVSLPVTEAI